ncbi:unnamed protein product [Kluyveromyces dobzhanskii CBS 2104]|uniref:WGS project CCBQ000000000 data, contig 00011 n=1 Tax=Kluyveromyces dobzhanskii CBS 2104 TaxID=1427455 RepID=A0A0A8L9M0_9SACH|nr:unnamed protein product [Kluyveromyces dobzhanskii CBS 2104]
MDAIIHDMENHKVQNDSGVMLEQETAERYLDVIIASAFSADEVDDALLLNGLGHLSELAAMDLWKERITGQLINRLYELIISSQCKDLATLHAALSVLTVVSEILIAQSPPSEVQLSHLCLALHSDSALLEQFAVLLESFENNPTTCQRIVAYLTLHIQCVRKWAAQGEKSAVQLSASTNTALKDLGILDQLSKLLYEHKNNKDLVGSIDQLCIQVKILEGLLKDLPCQGYDLKENVVVKELVRKLFDVYERNQERFLQSNEGYTDLGNFSVLQVLNVSFILRQHNLTFKKAFTEQLMFRDHPLPLLEAVAKLSDVLWEYFEMTNLTPGNALYKTHMIFHTKELMSVLLGKMVTIWGKTESETKEDFESLLQLIRILIRKADKVCLTQQESYVETFINVCDTSAYDDLRKLQVAEWREKQYNDWAEDIISFDEILQNQVQEFVRYQRLLLMQIGTWVYSENPIEAKGKLPKVSFIALSDNQMNLLTKEFKHKVEQTPTVEDNEIFTLDRSAVVDNKTIVIPLKNIVNIQTKQIELDRKLPEGARLINILQNTVYTGVTTYDRSGKISSAFFLESTESFFTWLDGLQLLSQSKNAKLSQETEKQIDTLIKLRKNVQLAALDDKFKDDDSVDSFSEEENDDIYYNPDTLKALCSCVHYE